MANLISLRKSTWFALKISDSKSPYSRAISIFIISLIILNLFAVALGTIESVENKISFQLDLFEKFSIFVFSIEYLLRLWSCVEEHRYSKPVFGRIKYLLSPLAIIDLLAILPFFLCFLNIDLRFIRSFRLLRIFWLAKITRYLKAFQLLTNVLRSKRDELIVTSILMLILLSTASFLVFFAEHNAQPDKFPNIPSSMWWAAATLTTIGYGDVFPITAMGKIFTAVIAIIGVGFFALPTGIISSGFMEEIQKRKKQLVCPHCGKEIK